jgi:hypothetical protein
VRPILEEIAASEATAGEPGWESVTCERIRARLREPLLEALAGRWHTLKRVTMNRQDESALAALGAGFAMDDAPSEGRGRPAVGLTDLHNRLKRIGADTTHVLIVATPHRATLAGIVRDLRKPWIVVTPDEAAAIDHSAKVSPFNPIRRSA